MVSVIIWKRNLSSIRIIASYDLEIHAWLNTFIEQWQGHKSKIAKLHIHNGKTVFNETFLMKGLALLFKVFVIFTMFTV